MPRTPKHRKILPSDPLTLSAIAGLLWGIWIINPFINTWESSPAYSLFLNTLPESLTGHFVVFNCLGLIISRYFKCFYASLILGTLLTGVYILISILMAFGSPPSTAGPIYMFLAYRTYLDTENLIIYGEPQNIHVKDLYINNHWKKKNLKS